MGYGAYSQAAHEAIATARVSVPVQEVFAQVRCHPLMDPNGISARESRDSPQHVETLAIAFALDITGSMGAIPDAMARRDLPQFMRLLHDFGVRDPQILFMAVGDAVVDRAPLQVGQFESTAELMDQWLTWTWLEGGGGSGSGESYELAMYFASQHIEMDCYRKRGRRGYLFVTGDDKPYPLLSRHVVKEVVGDEIDFDIPVRAVVETLQRSLEPFFLIPDLARRNPVERAWRDLLGDRVVCLEDPSDACIAAASLVALNERMLTLDGLAARLAQTDPGRVGRIARAIMPFAASIEADGAPSPALDHKACLPPEEGGPSQHRRTV